MTETSGPPRSVGSVADLRTRQADRTSHAMAQWEAEQLQAARDFGKRYAAALSDALGSTSSVIQREHDHTTQQIRANAHQVRSHSQQLAASAKTAAKMWWLPTLAICSLLIGGSLGFAWWTTTTATQIPAATDTITRNGQTFEVLTGPNWTTCTYNGQQHPCRTVKD